MSARRRITSLVAAALCCIAIPTAGAQNRSGDAGGIEVHATVSTPRAAVGSQVVVQIRIRGASDVGSVPFTLQFDPAILEFDGAASTEGDFLRKDGAQTIFLASPVAGEGGAEENAHSRASIAVGLSRLGTSGATGRGTLCRLVFRAKKAGATTLEFSRARVLDTVAGPLSSRFTGARVEVQEKRR